MCVLSACMSVNYPSTQTPQEEARSPGLELEAVLSHLVGTGSGTLDSRLEEQQVLLAAEPSLQPYFGDSRSTLSHTQGLTHTRQAALTAQHLGSFLEVFSRVNLQYQFLGCSFA